MTAKIVVHAEYPPIPTTRFDWCATYDDYDCDCDQDGFFSFDPVGYGETKEAAVLDLIENHPRPNVFCPERGLP